MGFKWLLTFSQIADGGDLEPQMFGLTTKFNKMQEVTINNENPAIGNVLLAEVKEALRNFEPQKIEISSPQIGRVNIVASDICINKIKALQPLIDKYNLIWFVRDNYTDISKVKLHLFMRES